jgi:tRNA pseudouridine55 synthase
MIMLFGTACKQASQFSKLDKTYLAEITLGKTSTTGDREGVITPTVIPSEVEESPFESRSLHCGRDDIERVLQSFVGQIEQTPSIYSAIKVAGKEAYKYARKGQAVEVPSRMVTIHELRITNYEYPKLQIETKVSSGTYIRSLAQDIGAKLGTGAYLSALIRSEIGDYKLEQAIELDSDPTVVARSLSDVQSN